MPVVKRAGMFSARHTAIIRWAKSRHTPTRSVSVSMADVMELLVLDLNLTCDCTHFCTASTRL